MPCCTTCASGSCPAAAAPVVTADPPTIDLSARERGQSFAKHLDSPWYVIVNVKLWPARDPRIGNTTTRPSPQPLLLRGVVPATWRAQLRVTLVLGAVGPAPMAARRARISRCCLTTRVAIATTAEVRQHEVRTSIDTRGDSGRRRRARDGRERLALMSHNAASLLVDWLAASLHSTLRWDPRAARVRVAPGHGPVRHAKLKQAARVFRVRYTGHSSSAAPPAAASAGASALGSQTTWTCARAASSPGSPRRTPPARTATPPRRRACRPCRRQRWRRRRQRWARLHSKASPPPTPRRATSRCRWTRWRRPARCIPAYTAQRRTPSTTAAPRQRRRLHRDAGRRRMRERHVDAASASL